MSAQSGMPRQRSGPESEPTGSPEGPTGSPVAVRLLDGFALHRTGLPVALPPSAQRLVAYLALSRPVTRCVTAGALWPESTEEHAQASLRTAVWRVNRNAPGLIVTEAARVGLASCVAVDSHELEARIGRMLRSPVPPAAPPPARTPARPDAPPPSGPAPGGVPPGPDGARPSPDEGEYSWLRSGDLLPGWYDDWVLLERERVRQLRLHALETAAQRLAVRGAHLEALQLAFEAVRLEPLRESAHRAVIAVHLAEGNVIDAVRHYEWFRAVLAAELGVAPSEHLSALVRGPVEHAGRVLARDRPPPRPVR